MWGTAPLFLWTNDQYHYYLTDHLGTPQRLVRSNGAITWAARYEAFGRAEVVENQVTNPLRFPGQYYDQETGTHYNFDHGYWDIHHLISSLLVFSSRLTCSLPALL